MSWELCWIGLQVSSLEDVGHLNFKRVFQSESWKLFFFLLNIFPARWETVGRREKKNFGRNRSAASRNSRLFHFPARWRHILTRGGGYLFGSECRDILKGTLNLCSGAGGGLWEMAVCKCDWMAAPVSTAAAMGLGFTCVPKLCGRGL